jgi:hypothetical protein
MIAVDDGEAVGGSGFVEDTVNVIFDRVFGEVKASGDLFIGESPADQLDQQMFTAA